MPKIKTSDLSGPALDWAVAKCEGVNLEAFALYYEPTELGDLDGHGFPKFHYSTIWSQGGPIIEREKISTCWEGTTWVATLFNKNCGETWYGHRYGPTALVAAMRCWVNFKLGYEVEIPEELAP